MSPEKQHIIERLRKEVNLLSGYKQPEKNTWIKGLATINRAFPDSRFPLAAVHEFISTSREQLGVTSAFIAGLLNSFITKKGFIAWVSRQPDVFPPGIQAAGLPAEQILFMQVKQEADVLWAMEEALKCTGLSAVIAEASNASFTCSRRFQLAVEKSQVTGFLIRNSISASASLCRWRISALPGITTDLPGIGFPAWKVELLKVRNGHPGQWIVSSRKGALEIEQHDKNEDEFSTQRKAG